MKQLAKTIERLDKKRARIIDELHPELVERVVPLLMSLDGRFAPYCGFRSEEEQKLAKASGASNADWLQSPHNFEPSLAVDVVLHPARVRVRPHKANPHFPDLWDDFTPEALRAWDDLDAAARRFGLERVLIRRGGALVRDRPHLQLFGWKSRLEQRSQ